MAHIYSIGLAGWDEDEDLRTAIRRGLDHVSTRCAARGCRGSGPGSGPIVRPRGSMSRTSCGMCREVGAMVRAARRAPARDCSGRNASVWRVDDGSPTSRATEAACSDRESKRSPARSSTFISDGRSSGACCVCRSFAGSRNFWPTRRAASLGKLPQQE